MLQLEGESYKSLLRFRVCEYLVIVIFSTYIIM
jgi:hypothetical protein